MDTRFDKILVFDWSWFYTNKESLRKFYLKFKDEIISLSWREICSGVDDCPVMEITFCVNIFYTASNDVNCGDNVNNTKSKLNISLVCKNLSLKVGNFPVSVFENIRINIYVNFEHSSTLSLKKLVLLSENCFLFWRYCNKYVFSNSLCHQVEDTDTVG